MASSNRTRSTTPTRRERRRAERAARASTQPVRGRAGASARSGPSLGIIATAVAIVAGLVLIAVVALSQGTPGGGGASNAAGGELVAPSFTVPGDLGDTPAQLGDPNAPIQMEVTEDFQCPVCARFTNEQLPRLVDDFVRPGLLHITVHDVAFLDYTGTESIDSATAAACAGEQGRYWEYHDWVYANQRGERQGAFAPDRLRQIAERIDLDLTAYDSCVAGTTEKATITAATNDAISKGINSTPTFVINGGQPIPGLPTYPKLADYLRSLLPSGAASPSASG
ncbi:MAG TPA: thioredoxin domain-containing protein [Candidatus Limnocylindrales bacterium]|nr:thioredoxin domain-containing protein [Candidatus Limnocylindrales bacterium]